ncbi:MAG: hypothetical protein FJX72_11470 [Armatimonadetes bacterium]|nr:hypothetical protein [Armatimonadota bacterium]
MNRGHPNHERLSVRDFSAFREADLEFVPGINAFVGQNGTGKTHLMQMLYVWQYLFSREGDPDLKDLLQREFRPDHLDQLVNLSAERPATAVVQGCLGGSDWDIAIAANGSRNDVVPVMANSVPFDVRRPVFIPALDMIGHTQGFATLYDEYRVDFSQSHRDLVGLLMGPEKRSLEPAAAEALAILSGRLGGELALEGERFYIRNDLGSLPITLTAEGIRKAAVLSRLIATGWLSAGATLFWDEPETNLNPSMMDEMVAALLALSRGGVQIFIATHSYVMLKELDLQSRQTDTLRLFSFEGTANGTRVRMFDRLADLTPNAILDQYNSLYDRDLTRATGRKRTGATLR